MDDTMKRRLAAVALAAAMSCSASVVSASGLATSATLPDGVYCEINQVKLFAQKAEDCEKAGGKVTHTVTTSVEPVEEKPKEKSKK